MNEVIQAVPKISDVVDAKGKQCNFVSCALLSVFRGIFLSKIYPSASNMWHEKSFFFSMRVIYTGTHSYSFCVVVLLCKSLWTSMSLNLEIYLQF